MKRVAFVVLIAGLAWLGAPDRALAQDQIAPPTGSEDNGRYSFHRMGEGFVRLDSRTGQMAQCGWSATGWACKLVPDERLALESEIGRLQKQNADLKKSLLSRGLELPPGIVADAPAETRPVPPADIPNPGQDSTQGPKSPAELDRAVAFVKDVWRRLVEMMVDLQRDIQRKS